MQLSISLPVPSAPQADPTPAANFLSDLAGGFGGSTGSAPQSFSEIMAGKPSADGSGSPSASGAPAPLPASAAPASTKPTTSQEEAAAALAAATLASLAPHATPAIAVELPSAAPKAVSPATSPVAGRAAPAAAPVAMPAAAHGAIAHAPAPKAPLSPLAAAASPPPTTATPAPAARVAAETAPAPAATGSLASQVAQAASGEKFAVPAENNAAPGSAAAKAAVKKIQSASGKQVTDSSQPVGTAVAKVTATMPPTATSERPASAAPAFAVTPVATSSFGSSTPQQNPQAETTGTAKGAVEAAMTAAEMLSSGAAPGSMNFQFSMGDADLNLRVELKNGSVQATFSTDSPQLRSDLANEWQSTASGSSQSGLHLAQPVFTGAGGSSTGGQQQGRNSSSSSETQVSSSRSFSGSPSAPASEAEPQLVPAAAAGSLYLQTFA